MLNVLCEKFPDSVRVNGVWYPIETDFREWIRFSALADDDTITWQIKLQLILQWFRGEIPRDLEAAVYALGDFLSAKALYPEEEQEDEGFENGTLHDGGGKQAVSFQQDANCIYAAFSECYGIDLQTIPYMHWWKFRVLFDGLPESAEIKQRMTYRTVDANKIKDKDERKRVKSIQKAIAIRKKRRHLSDYEIGDVFT